MRAPRDKFGTPAHTALVCKVYQVVIFPESLHPQPVPLNVVKKAIFLSVPVDTIRVAITCHPKHPIPVYLDGACICALPVYVQCQ